MKNKWKKIDKQEFLKLYDNNTYKELAIIFNVSKSTIETLVRNLKLKRRRFMDKINKQKFINFYNNHTCLETANEFKTTKQMVSKIAIKLNITRKSFKYKDMSKDFEFTTKQKDIINGLMLGDGCIDKQENINKNCRLSCCHSLKQKEYLTKISVCFDSIGYKISEGKRRKIISENNTGLIHSNTEKELNINFKTIVHPLFTELEKKWYKRDDNGEYILKPHGNNGRMQRIKIIPPDLELTPLTLAIWFFDDGCNSPKNKCIDLYTLSFSYEECVFLTNCLKDLGLNHCTINKIKNRNNEFYFSIRILSKSYLDFIQMVKPYNIYKCLEYKTNIEDYRESMYVDFYQKKEDNTSEVSNLHWSKLSNKWVAYININKKRIHLGYYSEKEKEIAILTIKKAFEMKNQGITDYSKYENLKYSLL